MWSEQMWSERKPMRLLRYLLVALGIALCAFLLYFLVWMIGLYLGLWGDLGR
jgi:predicted anti-sigma-YlaC factor YlaD